MDGLNVQFTVSLYTMGKDLITHQLIEVIAERADGFGSKKVLPKGAIASQDNVPIPPANFRPVTLCLWGAHNFS